MKHNVIIPRVPFVTVMMPLHESPVDFDVAAVCYIADTNDSLAKIGSPTGVQSAGGKDSHGAAVGCLENRLTDKLSAPDMTEKSFVENACAHTRKKP
jgi:hypothetical protein